MQHVIVSLFASAYLRTFLVAAPLLLSACSSVTGDDDDDDDEVVPIAVCATGDAAFATLTDAIAALPSGGAIAVCPGTYPERLVIAGKALSITGAGADRTFLDGGGAGTALTISDGADVTLTGFTIQHGVVAGSGGGGILCQDSVLSLTDSALADNRSDAGGGGLFATSSTVRIERTRIDANEGGPFGGGALLVTSAVDVLDSHVTGNSAEIGGGLAIVDGTATVRGNQLDANQARVRGGAIYLGNDGSIEDNQLTGNHSGWTGGGLYVWMHAPTIRGNTLDANTAVEEGGGAYFHQSHAIVLDNQITNNTAGDDGGGVRLFTCNARLERNYLANNHAAGDGGGLKSSHLPSELIDNQIVDNIADGAGGGLELDNDASVVRGGVISGNRASLGGGLHAALWPWNGGLIDGVRIANNRASSGGGIALENNFQKVTLRRLILDGNHATRGAGLYTRATTLSLANALLVANVASGGGGGVYARIPAPWSGECPCPPTDPTMELDFVVAHGNRAATGSALWTAVPNLAVESSVFTDHPGVAVAVVETAPPRWRYNDAVSATFLGMADPTGVDGNLAVPPQFADPTTGDFRLLAASHCIDAGDPALRDRDGSRADMGLFAGPDAP